VSESLFEQYKVALRRGHMAALAGELDDALDAYDAAARLVPDRALPLASRGTVLHRLDRWPEAAEAFDRALQLAPDDEAALRARATARAERGMRSGAADDFERLAFVLDVSGRAAPAADAAQRAAELEPSASRRALADRLSAAAAQLAAAEVRATGPSTSGAETSSSVDPLPARHEWAPGDDSDAGGGAATVADGADPEPEPDLQDPWGAALDARRLVGLEDTAGDPGSADAGAAIRDAEAGTPLRRPSIDESVAYDMLDALRAGMDAEAAALDEAPGGPAAHEGAPSDAPGDADRAEAAVGAAGQGAAGTSADAAGPEGPGDGGAWPPIDLPSPPPPPMVGPPPDPEELLAEAALVLEANEVDAARDLMLTAASVHRAAGRIDAALEICLNLLSIAPGDPRVHLAIANLQLDRGWSAIATEKIDLLVRLTSLTGDTQAEADVHGLASERLRDDPAPPAAARRG
jgi:tetratricopeptide (TPR) repeat protein